MRIAPVYRRLVMVIGVVIALATAWPAGAERAPADVGGTGPETTSLPTTSFSSSTTLPAQTTLSLPFPSTSTSTSTTSPPIPTTTSSTVVVLPFPPAATEPDVPDDDPGFPAETAPPAPAEVPSPGPPASSRLLVAGSTPPTEENAVTLDPDSPAPANAPVPVAAQASPVIAGPRGPSLIASSQTLTTDARFGPAEPEALSPVRPQPPLPFPTTTSAAAPSTTRAGNENAAAPPPSVAAPAVGSRGHGAGPWLFGSAAAVVLGVAVIAVRSRIHRT